MIIRAAKSTEVNTLAALGAIAWEQAFNASGENTALLKQNAEATYRHFCSTFWPVIIAAEMDSEIVGWGAVQNSDNKLTDLWVLPNFQRLGIGSALLEMLEEQIRQRAFDEVVLESHARNAAAVNFFKKHNYQVSGLKSSYAPTLDNSVETLEMRKRINDLKD